MRKLVNWQPRLPANLAPNPDARKSGPRLLALREASEGTTRTSKTRQMIARHKILGAVERVANCELKRFKAVDESLS